MQEFKDRMGIEAMGSVLKRNRFRLFNHVERKERIGWGNIEMEGTRPRGRPRKTWLEVVTNDMNRLGLASAVLDLSGGGGFNLSTPKFSLTPTGLVKNILLTPLWFYHKSSTKQCLKEEDCGGGAGDELRIILSLS